MTLGSWTNMFDIAATTAQGDHLWPPLWTCNEIAKPLALHVHDCTCSNLLAEA